MAEEKSGTIYDVVEHYLHTWAAPEIQQRKQDGRLPADFSIEHLQAVQVILNPEEQPRVKLNEEVKFQIVEDVAFGVTESGAIDPTDVQRSEKLELTDDDRERPALHVRAPGRSLALYLRLAAKRAANP